MKKLKISLLVFLVWAFNLYANEHIINLDKKENLALIKNDMCSAKIVALGENSHFIKEFFEIKDSFVKFLVQECNFTTLAYEIGFVEGLQINEWISGSGKNEDIKKYLGHFYYPVEFEKTLLWLRHYNQSHSKQVTFLGLDVPKNGGSLYPNLQVILDFVQKINLDSSILEDIKTIDTIAQKLQFNSLAQVAFAYELLTNEEKTFLTASLSSLKLRFENMESLYLEKIKQEEFDTVLNSVNGLIYLNYSISAMAQMLQGLPKMADMGARDKYMADIVQWHRSNNPKDKMILLAHNAHIQKVNVDFDGFISSVPLGKRLSKIYGSKYKALGMTSLGGNTAALYPNKDKKYGFEVSITPLKEPLDKSIEKYLSQKNIIRGYLFFDNKVKELNSKMIRLDSIYLNQDVKKAFDGIIYSNQSTVSEVVK